MPTCKPIYRFADNKIREENKQKKSHSLLQGPRITLTCDKFATEANDTDGILTILSGIITKILHMHYLKYIQMNAMPVIHQCPRIQDEIP